MENIYSQELTLTCYDTDPLCRLRPASFMNMAQEIAQQHATVLGFGYDDLIAGRTAWVLSRIHIRFLKYPLWRDRVTLSTWHKGAEGLFYLRDFLMEDAEGETLVAATSSWLVLNVDTRHLSRESGITDNGTSCARDAIEEHCGRIRIPAGAEAVKAGEHHVAYSDVDMNGHANNVSYLVWVTDCLDFEFIRRHPVRELEFNFNSEIHPGEVVELYRYDAGGKVYFEGRTVGRSAFVVELAFE
ncbi:MAG: thioesterase [Bacteroidales bacterium]|nr:thioesterase [Bacteroidales bacterium]